MSFSVDVENIGHRSPITWRRNQRSRQALFVVWGGANDFIHGGVSVADGLYSGGQSVHQHPEADPCGRDQFIVPNLPPLGLVPRINGDPSTAALVNLVVAYYNGLLNLDIQLLLRTNHQKHLQIAQLDVFGLFKRILPRPRGLLAVKCDWQIQRCRGRSRHLFILGRSTPDDPRTQYTAINAAAILARSNCMSAARNGKMVLLEQARSVRRNGAVIVEMIEDFFP